MRQRYYYDVNGERISLGDKVTGHTCFGEKLTGKVHYNDDGEWYLGNEERGGYSPDLWLFNDLEILERNNGEVHYW